MASSARLAAIAKWDIWDTDFDSAVGLACQVTSTASQKIGVREFEFAFSFYFLLLIVISQSCWSCAVLGCVSSFRYWHTYTPAFRSCSKIELHLQSVWNDDQVCTEWMPFFCGARQALLSAGCTCNVYIDWVIVCWPGSWVIAAVNVNCVLVFLAVELSGVLHKYITSVLACLAAVLWTVHKLYSPARMWIKTAH